MSVAVAVASRTPTKTLRRASPTARTSARPPRRAASRRRGPRGRLSEAVVAAIVRSVRCGAPPETAAAAVGISRRTFFRWRARGRAAEKLYEAGEDLSPDDDAYLDFLDRVDQAEAQAAVEASVRLFEAGKRSWRAAVALLERRFPEDWGTRRCRCEKRVPIPASPAPLVLDRLTNDEFETLSALLEKAAADPARLRARACA